MHIIQQVLSRKWTGKIEICGHLSESTGIYFTILPGRQPVFFFECFKETGIITKAIGEAGLADLRVAEDGAAARIQSSFRDKLMDRDAHVLFEHMRNIVFTYIEMFGKAVQRQITVQVTFDIADQSLI